MRRPPRSPHLDGLLRPRASHVNVARALEAAAAQVGGERRVAEHARDRVAQRLDVPRRDEQRAPVATSSGAEPVVVTTGAPHAIASSTGRPKPSAIDGYTKRDAPRYSAIFSSSETKPSRRMRPRRAPPRSLRRSPSAPQPGRPAITSSMRDVRARRTRVISAGHVLARLERADEEDERIVRRRCGSAGE